jgi:cytochrome c oxidase subunit 2
MAPAGPSAHMAADLWWGMFIVAALVLLVVVALWIYALCRSPRTYDAATQQRIARRWIIGGGIILPGVTVVTLLVFGIPMGHRMLPLPDEEAFRIDVIGHQWWWEVRYPEHGIDTADHLVIPAGRPIDVHVATSRSTGPSIDAAATTRAVTGDSAARSWSARTSTAISAPPSREPHAQ